MSFKRVSPSEAHDMIEKEGYVYVDVRSLPEFDAGHPPGAYNVPLAHMGPNGMAANPDFLKVMAVFPKDAKLVLGCQGGGRSARAAEILQSVGYTDVVDQRAGFGGGRDPSGRPEPGWQPAGLPVSKDSDPEHTYEALKAKAR